MVPGFPAKANLFKFSISLFSVTKPVLFVSLKRESFCSEEAQDAQACIGLWSIYRLCSEEENNFVFSGHAKALGFFFPREEQRFCSTRAGGSVLGRQAKLQRNAGTPAGVRHLKVGIKKEWQVLGLDYYT